MKWLTLLILAVLAVGCYWYYKSAINEQTRIHKDIVTLQQNDDRDDAADKLLANLKNNAEAKISEKTLAGILLTLLVAGTAGVLFVTLVLPLMAHYVAHAVYDSGEMLETDTLHDAHSLMAQGEYVKAIEAFKVAAARDPLNRLPWVEIAKIQRTNQYDPEAAIQTLETALEGQEWQINDAAYLLFRLAELYDEDRDDRAAAVGIMRKVIDEFPETRHSANARHRLRDWGLT